MKPILTVKDRAIDAYNDIFAQETTAQAVRTFTDMINSDPTRSNIARHPDDFDLYVIGHFDDQTAKISPLPQPELVVRGKDVIRPKGE